MVNSKKIKDRMKNKKILQKDIALELGCASATVSQKINNVRPIMLREAEIIARILEIPDSDFGSYFFAN